MSAKGVIITGVLLALIATGGLWLSPTGNQTIAVNTKAPAIATVPAPAKSAPRIRASPTPDPTQTTPSPAVVPTKSRKERDTELELAFDSSVMRKVYGQRLSEFLPSDRYERVIDLLGQTMFSDQEVNRVLDSNPELKKQTDHDAREGMKALARAPIYDEIHQIVGDKDFLTIMQTVAQTNYNAEPSGQAALLARQHAALQATLLEIQNKPTK